MICNKTNRVLVVDDFSIMRRTIIRMLKLGLDDTFVFVEAEDGNAALAEIQASEFDLVISDWSMPKMNGLELAKNVRSLGCSVPFLMITANEEQESAANAIREGVTEYLVKPFNQESLLDACAKYLTGRPVNAVVG